MILHRHDRRAVIVVAMLFAATARAADDLPTFVGPAMGTTYRVTLAAPIPGLASGELHRELETVLARIDRAANTWRQDSDASRFNRAVAGEWVDVADDLIVIVEIARQVHEESRGAFDITAAPLVRVPGGATLADAAADAAGAVDAPERTGMRFVETRPANAGRPAAIRKTRDAVAIDLGGIGPGYAVDQLGERLLGLGSRAHLVELGGEVRGWGRSPGGEPWRVRFRPAEGPPRTVHLVDGEAIATSTRRPGRSPIDPRTGRPSEGSRSTATVRAESCAWADAWAVAAIVLDMAVDTDGTIRGPQAPSTPAVRPAARPTAP